MKRLDEILEMAISRCNDWEMFDKFNMFNMIYLFTTENISGYISEFNLKDKTLLTVGSSGDQVLNAILYDTKKVTLLDINPYARYYYYLKVAGILTFDMDKYLSFFYHNGKNLVFGKKNNEWFNLEDFAKLVSNLKEIDMDSYIFWSELFKKIKILKIRQNLFSLDIDRIDSIKKFNPYLDSDSYNKLKRVVADAKVDFVVGDMLKANIQNSFDNIWLSNIGSYLSLNEISSLIEKVNNNLSEDGKLLISYLYDLPLDGSYVDGWDPIYNLKEIFAVLHDYSPEVKMFNGVDNINKSNGAKDAVLVYKKKR